MRQKHEMQLYEMVRAKYGLICLFVPHLRPMGLNVLCY